MKELSYIKIAIIAITIGAALFGVSALVDINHGGGVWATGNFTVIQGQSDYVFSVDINGMDDPGTLTCFIDNTNIGSATSDANGIYYYNIPVEYSFSNHTVKLFFNHAGDNEDILWGVFYLISVPAVVNGSDNNINDTNSTVNPNTNDTNSMVVAAINDGLPDNTTADSEGLPVTGLPLVFVALACIASILIVKRK